MINSYNDAHAIRLTIVHKLAIYYIITTNFTTQLTYGNTTMNHVTQYICPDGWHAQYMAATRLNITQCKYYSQINNTRQLATYYHCVNYAGVTYNQKNYYSSLGHSK